MENIFGQLSLHERKSWNKRICNGDFQHHVNFTALLVNKHLLAEQKSLQNIDAFNLRKTTEKVQVEPITSKNGGRTENKYKF